MPAAEIGVSNFSPRQIEPLLELEVPAVLQLELHPLLQRPMLRAFCERHGILLQAYGHYKPELEHQPVLRQLVQPTQLPNLVPKPAGLLAMRWSLQAGAAAIPRSRTLLQLEANLHLFWRGFEQLLPPPTAAALEALDRNQSLYGLHDVFVRDLIS